MNERQNRQVTLQGLTLAVSISESEGLAGLGFDSRDVNQAVFEISRAVLAQGGVVAFGHDWRPGGVMSALLDFAMLREKAWRQVGVDPRIINYVAWPDKPALTDAARKQLEGLLGVHEMPEPEVAFLSNSGTSSLENSDNLPEIQLIQRVVALTDMRRKLTRDTSARICLGGRVEGSQGQCAGIVEEAFQSIFLGRPLYLSRLFGGAAAQVVDVLEGQGKALPRAFQPGHQAVTDALESLPELLIHRVNVVWNPSWSVETLVKANGLTVEENRALFNATHLEDVIGLVLQGLGRARSEIIDTQFREAFPEVGGNLTVEGADQQAAEPEDFFEDEDHSIEDDG